MSATKVNVAVVGLGFGESFLPIYRDHPDVGELGIVEPEAARRDQVGDRHGITHRYADLETVLTESDWDAVHLLSPVRFHAEHTVAVLESGKHCACAVPMATDLADIDAILAAQRRAGTNYTMMETSRYTREYLTARQLYDDGELGEINLYKGFHLQNLDGYPTYWQGFPPMQYVTHALSPMLDLIGGPVTTVRAVGSGRLSQARRTGGFDNRFPTEVALFELQNATAIAEVTVSFSQLSRGYVEGFNVYGDRMGLEWPARVGGPLQGFRLRAERAGQRGRRVDAFDVTTDDHAERLPAPLRRYTRAHRFEPADGSPPTTVHAGHGGSHPHLVDDFIASIVTGRPSAIPATTAANFTAPGIVAHASAMSGGEALPVPAYGAA